MSSAIIERAKAILSKKNQIKSKEKVEKKVIIPVDESSIDSDEVELQAYLHSLRKVTTTNV